jgi:hypothetical protein
VVFVAINTCTEEYHKFYGGPLYKDDVRDKYMLLEGRAIRLDEEGKPISYKPSDMAFILRAVGVIERVTGPS